MPSPVFLRKGTYGRPHGPRPYAPHEMDFRRAACPHAAAKDGQCRPPLRMDLGPMQPGRCGHRPLRRFPSQKSPSAPKMGRSVLLDFDFYFLALLSTT